MSTRRAMLAATASALVIGAGGGLSVAAYPDADLLALCARLEKMRAEWQRLYDATSEEDELTTPADRAWQDYSDHVWPLVHSNSFTAPPGVVDLPSQLLTLRATTPEGIRAKAAAILAMDDAATYCDGRDDAYQLCLSLLRDAAGVEYRPLGDAAAVHTPHVGPAALQANGSRCWESKREARAQKAAAGPPLE